MNSKDKANLSYLYELDQYKSLVRLVAQKRKEIAELLLNVDMSELNADKKIALLQGQAFALHSLLAKIKELHKNSMNES